MYARVGNSEVGGFFRDLTYEEYAAAREPTAPTSVVRYAKPTKTTIGAVIVTRPIRLAINGRRAI